MSEWQWQVVVALCRLFLATINNGEKFDSVEAMVQYSDELSLINQAVSRADGEIKG